MKKKLLVSVLALALGVVLLALNCFGSYESELDEFSGTQFERNAISAGLFYVNNKGTGHYLKYNSTVTGESGLLSNLSTYIKWYFYETSNGYTIHPNNASGDMYLALTTDGTGVEVISSNEYREYPERCYWDLFSSANGYLLRGRFVNANSITTYRYLQDTGTGFQLISALPATGTYLYNKCEWRIVSTSDYGSTSSYTYRELGYSFSINAVQMYVGDNNTPSVNPYPTNALWASAGDFTYVENSTISHVSITNGMITANVPGTTTIVATHKVTGRTKTFNITINYLPTSGSEVAYEPLLWNNSNVCHNLNCYAYAINSQLIPGTNDLWPYSHDIYGYHSYCQPGYSINSTNNNADITTLLSHLHSDSFYWNLNLTEVLKNDVCQSGSYKIAIVLAPGLDYHFYRQNPDGTWSHKMGAYPTTTDKDASGNTIYDPQMANRDYSNSFSYNYYLFVGYYSVTPQNTYYSSKSVSFVYNQPEIGVLCFCKCA